MKTLFKLTMLGIILALFPGMSFAQTSPQSIYIDCQSPSGSQSGLKRPRGDGNVWVFQIIPGADVHWVEGPNWSYPGKGGSDPSWGQWNGGDGSLSLSWISPDHTGAFSIGVTGKITCGSGGGGGPIDISATWSGDVLAKEWKPEPAISGGEVTQPAGADEENPKEVGPGETVNLAVSEATDHDTWTQVDDTDQEADTVHYKWTSGDGGFVTDDHPDGDATEVTTTTAQWKAPEEPGNYTVTCEIDDEPAAVEDPDTGDRDDDAVTRTVHIKVVVGESSATLKLYKDAELTEEATGAIGGNVYVVLEVKLGKYQKLASNNATLRIEENYDQHSETERRWDQTVNFDNGWQKKDGSGNWQASEATPQTKNTSGDDEYFRKVWSWATYSQPLGHNEQHTVQLVNVDGGEDTELSFTPTNEGDDGKDGPESVSAEVANLVITDVSTNSDNPDYFLYNPDPNASDDLQNPVVKFTFTNAGDTESSHNRYHWWLWVRATDQTNFATYEGYMDAPGEKSVPINPQNLPSVGTYAIDIHVWDTKNDDLQGILSKHLELASHSFELVNNPSANLEGQISYQISSDRDAQKLTVDLFNPSLDKLKSYDGGTEKNHLYEDINLYTFTDEDPGGTYIALFTAKDDFADAYRDHKSRDILALNQKYTSIPLHFWIDPDTAGRIGSEGGPIDWKYIQTCFGIINIHYVWGANNVSRFTQGDAPTSVGHFWSFPAHVLSPAQEQATSGKNIIIYDYVGNSAGALVDGVIGELHPQTPADIAAVSIKSTSFAWRDNQDYPDQSNTDLPVPYYLDPPLDPSELNWLSTNGLLHEITHSLWEHVHCGDETDHHWPWEPTLTSTPKCVIYKIANKNMTKNMSQMNTVPYLYRGQYRSFKAPWHSLREINGMLGKLHLPEFQPIDNNLPEG